MAPPGQDDELLRDAVDRGDNDELRLLLHELCEVTGMGFAALARVTDHRWIACQSEDRARFGIDAGDELEIGKTICDEVRGSGEAIVFDDASDDIKWSRHPVPVIYGFKSYCSFPVYLSDGSFYGTLCAIDPEPRSISDEQIVALVTEFARRAGEIISRQ